MECSRKNGHCKDVAVRDKYSVEGYSGGRLPRRSTKDKAETKRNQTRAEKKEQLGAR